ncbi:MAG: four helix bundle protein [Phycisphaerae bacterium]
MASAIKSFRDLIAWQKAIEFCKQVYAVSTAFPDSERFGLTSQIRRAVVSIPSNIAEGYGRRRTKDYLRFLDVAHGSLCEVETQLVLSSELGFTNPSSVGTCMELVHEVDRILNALVQAVRQSATRY